MKSSEFTILNELFPNTEYKEFGVKTLALVVEGRKQSEDCWEVEYLCCGKRETLTSEQITRRKRNSSTLCSHCRYRKPASRATKQKVSSAKKKTKIKFTRQFVPDSDQVSIPEISGTVKIRMLRVGGGEHGNSRGALLRERERCITIRDWQARRRIADITGSRYDEDDRLIFSVTMREFYSGSYRRKDPRLRFHLDTAVEVSQNSYHEMIGTEDKKRHAITLLERASDIDDVPQKRLLFAVLRQAIIDLEPPKSRFVDNSFKWFRGGHFAVVAALLGINPEYVSKVLYDAGLMKSKIPHDHMVAI